MKDWLIYLVTLLSILLIWFPFYKLFFDKRGKWVKISTIIGIVLLNGGIFYWVNYSMFNQKKQIFTFDHIKTTLSLDNLKDVIDETQFNLYQKNIENDIFNSIKTVLKKNSIKLTRDSDKNFDVMIYSFNKPFQIIIEIKFFQNGKYYTLSTEYEPFLDYKNKTYDMVLYGFKDKFSVLLDTINLWEKIKILGRDKILDNIYNERYQKEIISLIFEHFIVDNYQIPSKFLKFILNMRDINLSLKVMGYSIEHNRCSVLGAILDYAFYSEDKILSNVMDAIILSKCDVVEGFLRVLSKSNSLFVSARAKMMLKKFIENRELYSEIEYSKKGKK